MYKFSDLLKKIRTEAGLTQENLAHVLGVSTILIAMIETEQKQVSKKFIEILANKLDVHPSSITPFIFIEDNLDHDKLSKTEKTFISFGEKLQNFLVKTRAKRLRAYV